VHVYKPGEYAGMRTFLARDGKSGFAIKGDDIVSLFKHPSSTAKHVADAALKQAVENGGRRLDAFDTLLPGMYAKSGFRAVARLKWNDKYAPAGWDKDTFKEFNKGEPDVVFMVHDPEHAGKYKKGDGKYVASYDEGKAEQDKALAKIHSHPGEGYSKDAWVDTAGVIHTDSVKDAQRALYENKKVELHQVKQVSTLIHNLGKEAKRWQEQGHTAPTFNLCNVSVEGTNLFCAESKGIPRVEMPVIPAKQTKDFINFLKDEGFKVEKGNERADHLRATQSEISGAKVAASMDRIEKEGFYKRLVISRDDYILDGHHTWAGEIGLEAKKGTLGAEKTVKIARVNISITKLIAEAEKFTGGKGKKPASEAAKTIGEIVREWIERQPGHDVSDEPRDESGRWTEGGGGGGADAESANMRLVGTGQNRERTEKWIADLENQLAALPTAELGGEKDQQLNGMKTALQLYLQSPAKLRGSGERSLHEVHDGNGKLLSAVYTMFNPETNVSSIDSMGGLEHASLVKALGHMITHEEKDNRAERIEMSVFDDDATRLAALKEVGFQADPGSSGHGVSNMIKGKATTDAEKARAARQSAEHSAAILGAGQATATLLGYDAKLVRTSNEDHTFTLTGTVRHAAGLAHLATGVITLYPERIYSAEAAVGVAAHEVAHQKYQTVLNFLNKELDAVGEAERQATQQGRESITKPDGTLRDQYRDQFPLTARFEKHRDSLARRIKTDGVTAYSKDYWKEYEADKGIVALKSASHETIAEMARLEAEREKSTASLAWRSYYRDVMKSYDEIQAKLEAAKAKAA
jgi:hypothetical protein